MDRKQKLIFNTFLDDHGLRAQFIDERDALKAERGLTENWEFSALYNELAPGFYAHVGVDMPPELARLDVLPPPTPAMVDKTDPGHLYPASDYKEVRAPTREDVEWALAYESVDVAHTAAPSSGAWALLVRVRAGDTKVWVSYLNRLLGQQATERMTDTGQPALDHVTRTLEAFKESAVS